jgi:plastocyanin
MCEGTGSPQDSREPLERVISWKAVCRFMKKANRNSILVIAVIAAGLGFPTAVSAFSAQSSILAISPQVTMISIPSGSGITQSSQGYAPASVVVVIGVNNTVTWTDKDDQMDANGYSPNHTVTANDQSFTSNSLAVGDQFTYTFGSPGTYSYHCKIHSWMNGMVIVKGTATPTPEFPLPFVVLTIGLGVAAVAFSLNRRASDSLLAHAT